MSLSDEHGFGALKERIEPEKREAEGIEAPGRKVLSCQKLRLLEFLFRYPYATLPFISEKMRMSRSNVRWHLKELMDCKFISTVRLGKTRVYYPPECFEPEPYFLATLNSMSGEKLWSSVTNQPGIDLSAIMKSADLNYRTASKLVDTMANEGILLKVREGKYIRIYPTELIEEKASEHRRKIRFMKSSLLRKLKSFTPSVNIVSSTDRLLRVTTVAGGKRLVLEFWMNPYRPPQRFPIRTLKAF